MHATCTETAKLDFFFPSPRPVARIRRMKRPSPTLRGCGCLAIRCAYSVVLKGYTYVCPTRRPGYALPGKRWYVCRLWVTQRIGHSKGCRRPFAPAGNLYFSSVATILPGPVFVVYLCRILAACLRVGVCCPDSSGGRRFPRRPMCLYFYCSKYVARRWGREPFCVRISSRTVALNAFLPIPLRSFVTPPRTW